MTLSTNLLPADAPTVHALLVQAWTDFNREQAPRITKFEVSEWSSDQHECFVVHRHAEDGGRTSWRFGQATKLTFIPNGSNVSGRILSEVVDGLLLEKAVRAIENCLRYAEPYYSEYISSQFGRNCTHFKRLSLPLADDNGCFRSVFGSVVRVQD